MAGTSADKLALLRATKADLKAALTEKGQTPGDVFFTYPGLVRAIPTGVTLPELTNPAAEEQVLSGYEFIDGTGAKKTGSYVAPSGGGVDTCTLTISGYNTAGNSAVGYAVTRYVDGEMKVESANALTAASVTITDVVCGSFFYVSGNSHLAANYGGGVAEVYPVPSGLYSGMGMTCAFQAPATAGAIGTITIVED